MNEELNRALLEVLKHDEKVSQDDPYYAMTEEQVLPIHAYLGSILYQPYLDWSKEVDSIADKESISISVPSWLNESVNDIMERTK